MPKKSMRNRSRGRRGGDTDPSTGNSSSWDPSTWEMPTISNPFASTDSSDNDVPPPPSTPPPTSNTPPLTSNGGRKKRRRSMRGGNYSDNTPLTGLAATAASFSNGNTASASYVGGRTRRRRHRHRHTKSCKKSCRKH